MSITMKQSYLLGTSPPELPIVAPAILRKRVMTSQPQYAAQIDGKYKDAITVFNAATPSSNIATGSAITRIGTPTFGVCQNGVEVHSDTFSAGNILRVRSGINPSAMGWSGVTIICRIVLKAYTLYPSISYLAPSGEYYGGWNLTTQNTRELQFYAGNSATKLTLTYSASAENVPATIIATFDRVSGRRKIYLKAGSYYATASDTNAVGWVNLSCLEQIGGYDRGGYRTSPHFLSMECVLPRELGAGEVAGLLDNPYQIFLAPNAQPWVATP